MVINFVAVGVGMIKVVLADPIGAVEISEVGFPAVEVSEVALARSRFCPSAVELAGIVSGAEALLQKWDNFLLGAAALIGHLPHRTSRVPLSLGVKIFIDNLFTIEDVARQEQLLKNGNVKFMDIFNALKV